jgi:hypothetical protein
LKGLLLVAEFQCGHPVVRRDCNHAPRARNYQV